MADVTTSTRDRDPDSIRRDIENNREDMDETVAALGDRLSPGRLVDNAWDRIRGSEGGGIGNAIREHPVPVALVGMGLAWLAIEQARGGSEHEGRRSRTRQRAAGRRGPYGGDAIDHEDPDWVHEGEGEHGGGLKEKASRAASSVKEKVSETASTVREKASDAAHSVMDKTHVSGEHETGDGGVRERVADTARRVGSRARRTRERAMDGFWEMLEDSPLTLGAITFGVGLASGLVAPSTRIENRALGRTSETVKDEVERVGRETARKAKTVAQDATGAALEEAHHQVDETTGEIAEEAKSAARNVGRAAKDAAAESAEREELTAEGMKREAKKAGQRARSGARSGPSGGENDPNAGSRH